MEKLTESIFDKDKLQLEEEEEIKNTITNVELYSDAATRLGDGGDLTMTTRHVYVMVYVIYQPVGVQM